MSETSNTELKANLNQIRSCRLAEKYREDDKERICERNKQQHYEANKEQIHERNKQQYEANKEQVLEQQKQYREANKEHIIVRNKQYREANKEQYLEQQKQHYEANKEQTLERQKQHREANKDRINARRRELYQAKKEEQSEPEPAGKEPDALPFVEYCITNNNFLPQPEPATCPQRTCSLSALTYACHHLHTARSSRIVRRLLSLFPSLLIPSAQPLPHTTRSRLKILASAPDRWGKLLENG